MSLCVLQVSIVAFPLKVLLLGVGKAILNLLTWPWSTVRMATAKRAEDGSCCSPAACFVTPCALLSSIVFAAVASPFVVLSEV